MKVKQTNILMFITLIYYVLIYLGDIMSLGNALLLISMVSFLAYNLWTNNGKLRLCFNSLHFYILAFTLFTLASSMWATRRNLTIPKFNAMLFIFIGMIVVGMDNSDESSQKRLLNCLLYGNYAVVYISVTLFGWRNIISMIAAQERYATVLINANRLGMCAAYAVIINFYKIISQRHRLSWEDLLMIPAMITIVASGSRKAILIIVAGVVGVLLVRNAKHFFQILRRGLLIIPVVILALVLLSRVRAFGRIMDRMEDVISVFSESATRYNNTVWLRKEYIDTGMNLFRNHPLLGIGIGNSNYYADLYYGKNQYFHNNFVELLACGGLIGFFLYYSIYIWLIGIMIKYRKYKDEMYDICLVLLIIAVFVGFAMVQYFDKSTYFELLFFWIEAKKLKNQAKQQSAEVARLIQTKAVG